MEETLHCEERPGAVGTVVGSIYRLLFPVPVVCLQPFGKVQVH